MNFTKQIVAQTVKENKISPQNTDAEDASLMSQMDARGLSPNFKKFIVDAAAAIAEKFNANISRINELKGDFIQLLGTEEQSTEHYLGSTQSVIQSTSGFFAPEEIIQIGKNIQDLCETTIALINKQIKLVMSGSSLATSDVDKSWQKKAIQQAKVKALMVTQSKSMGVLLETIGPYQRQIDILKPRLAQVNAEYSAYSQNIGVFGQALYPLFLQYEAIANQILNLYQQMMISLANKKQLFTQTREYQLVQFLNMKIGETQTRFVTLLVDVQTKRKNLLPALPNSGAGAAAPAFQFAENKDKENIKLGIFKSADGALRKYFNDLLGNYGDILEYPWKFRKPTVKIKRIKKNKK